MNKTFETLAKSYRLAQKTWIKEIIWKLYKSVNNTAFILSEESREIKQTLKERYHVSV